MLKIRCDQFLIILTLINLTQSTTKFPLILRPFRELAHGLKSGPIQILDDKTISISNLHYDGLGPDVHFWVGKGVPSPDGLLVPNENNSAQSLSAYNGETITIKLPDNLTISDIDYLSMWCIKNTHNFGHIYMNETLRQWRIELSDDFLQPFRQLSHGVQSGPIKVFNNTFRVTNLYYDGQDPDTHFWIGKGIPSPNGTIVPNENGSVQTLLPYNGSNVTLQLPGNVTTEDIDYLAIWSIKDSNNFGHTFMYEALRDADITDYVLNFDNVGIQLDGFISLAHGLKSGPIIVVDEKTFYISNLFYDGKGPDAHFWVGRGTQPSPSGTKVDGEKGYKKTLPKYDGQSIYVTLPGNVTMRDIDYFGVWCIEYKHNFGYTNVKLTSHIAPYKGHPELTDDGRNIIRIPKCCPHGTVVDIGGCNNSSESFNVNINAHMGNSTHLNDEPLSKSRVVYVPYIQNIECAKFALEPDKDNYSLVTTGTLLYISERKKYAVNQYCFDTVDLEHNNKYITTPFLCANMDDRPSTMHVVYAVFIFISVVFLIITSSLYGTIRKIKDNRGMCITGYTGAMAIAFFCLGLTQVTGTGNSCSVLGYMFQFSIVSSFTCFTAISYEVWYLTKYFNDDCVVQTERKRRLRYLLAAIIIPAVFLVASVIYHVIPVMPTGYLEITCGFTSDLNKKLFLFIPIFSSIMVNLVINTWTYIMVNKNNTLEASSPVWQYMRKDIRWKVRGCWFMWGLMVLCWFAEVVSLLFGKPVMFLDIIHSLQGVIMCLILLTTNPPRKEIVQYIRNICNRSVESNTRNGQTNDFTDSRNGQVTELSPLK